MQTVKDMASKAKEKAKELSAKTEEKAGKATARTHPEKEMTREHGKAKEAQAKADYHQEKAEHRATAGTTHVPLTRDPRHPRSVGGAAATYPATGDFPAGEKYF